MKQVKLFESNIKKWKINST